MASGAAEMVLGCVFNGSLSLHDFTVERRPYHNNCGCALHDLKGTVCSNTCSKKNSLSFYKKQAWSENHSLSLSSSVSKCSSHSSLLVIDSSNKSPREAADQVLSIDHP